MKLYEATAGVGPVGVAVAATGVAAVDTTGDSGRLLGVPALFWTSYAADISGGASASSVTPSCEMSMTTVNPFSFATASRRPWWPFSQTMSATYESANGHVHSAFPVCVGDQQQYASRVRGDSPHLQTVDDQESYTPERIESTGRIKTVGEQITRNMYARAVLVKPSENMAGPDIP